MELSQPLQWHQTQYRQLLRARTTFPQALLLHGQRGIGKLTFARALAQALLCEAAQEHGACGNCVACGWLKAEGHPDYQQIEPANAAAEPEGDIAREESDRKSAVINVHQIRALSNFINVSSHRGGPKLIIVHPVEALNANAGNALLKNLEEPPPRTHFVLVTHRPQQLLPTITSRCQRIGLHVPAASAAASWLEKEGVRDAELALAHMGCAPLLARELAGDAYWRARSAFLRALIVPEFDVLAAADSARDCSVPDVIAWLQKWSYDLVHYRVAGRVRYNPDHQDAIARIAARADVLSVLRFHRHVVGEQRIAQHPVNARLFLEQVLFAYREAISEAATINA